METQYATDLIFDVPDIRLDTENSETKWDNVYFESSLGTGTIMNPIYPNTGDAKSDETMKLQGLKSAFETYKKN
jgi:hypothetical protein